MLKVGDKILLTGAALVQAVERLGQVEIAHRPDFHDFLYTFQHAGRSAVVLLKISTGGRRWQFTFTPDDLKAMEAARQIGSLFVGLVCNRDGVCCLSDAELREVFAEVDPGEVPFVGVTRPPGGSYRVNGREGARLDRKVPMSDWPAKLKSAKRQES